MKSRGSVLMMPLSTLYRAITQTRLAAYRRGLFRTSILPVPVISVGNLTTGGTGKTPLVEWVCRATAEEIDGRDGPTSRPAGAICVLTRGYKKADPAAQVLVSDGERILATEAEAGDEPSLLARNLLGIAAVVANPNRVAAAEWAIKSLGTTVFVLDDGFQHLRLGRDLDIVTIDATNPFAGGELLPSGRLREPIQGLSRADCAVLTRVDQIENLRPVQDAIQRLLGGRPVFTSRMVTTGLRGLNGEVAEKSNLNDQPMGAFCGVGNPESFFTQIRQAGLQIRFSRVFPDHHNYSQLDIDRLVAEAKSNRVHSLITTAKDASRLTSRDLAFPCLVLEIRISIDEDVKLRTLIRNALSPS